MANENIFLAEAKEMQEELIRWRRALHRIPEVGTNLPQTMAYIKERLEEMNIPYQFYSDISCVAATIGAGKKCKFERGSVRAICLSKCLHRTGKGRGVIGDASNSNHAPPGQAYYQQEWGCYPTVISSGILAVLSFCASITSSAL